MSLSMEEAHRRDYAEMRRMDDLRHAIDKFLEDPPSRLHRFAQDALKNAAEQLWEDHQRIVKAWD